MSSRCVSLHAFTHRRFLTSTVLAVAGVKLGTVALPDATPSHLPRWRGFNLFEQLSKRRDRNPFFLESGGNLASNRADVAYENWRGHKLDRKMLELVQA
jgi:hypothetical protein